MMKCGNAMVDDGSWMNSRPEAREAPERRLQPPGGITNAVCHGWHGLTRINVRVAAGMRTAPPSADPLFLQDSVFSISSFILLHFFPGFRLIFLVALLDRAGVAHSGGHAHFGQDPAHEDEPGDDEEKEKAEVFHGDGPGPDALTLHRHKAIVKGKRIFPRRGWCRTWWRRRQGNPP